MKKQELDEIFECLGDERRVFHYFKNRYCLDAIDRHIDKEKRPFLTVNELKKGCLQRFSNKPIVKELIAQCGDGRLTQERIRSYWSKDPIFFTLSLSRWGCGDRYFDQTSRNQQNLVLQINFDNQHLQEYQRLLKPSADGGPFEYYGHPIARGRRKTLSWVRLDIDLSTGEALIEEIQNDWLRRAKSSLARMNHHLACGGSLKPGDIIHGVNCEYEDLREYTETVLKPYNDLWAEASLQAAIHFIRKDLGISSIYYHSFETGHKLKKIYGLPPRSMYTQLPRQFGFQLTSKAPEFLLNTKSSKRYLKAIKNPQWYWLE